MLHMPMSEFCAPRLLKPKYYAKFGLNVTYVKFLLITTCDPEFVLWLTVSDHFGA